METAWIVKVAVSAAPYSIDKPYDYLVPEELERRLTERGTDTPDKIQKRLQRAREDFSAAGNFDYFVINDTVEKAVEELVAIFTAEHCKADERMEILSGK